MAVRIGDTLKQLNNADFPIVEATDVAFSSGDSLQKLYDDKKLGGGSAAITISQEEFDALDEQTKLENDYHCYDTGRLYYKAVQYGGGNTEELTMAEYKERREQGTLDNDTEYIVTSDEQGILLEASDIGYSNAVSNLPCTTVQGAIDKVVEKVDGLISDTTSSTTSTWSSQKTSDEIADIESALDELENITRLTDFDEAIPEKGKNKIYYVNKSIGTYKCAQWRVESMYYDVSGLEQYRGVQKATSINGVDNIMLMREYYLDDNVMRWSAWQELATMDKVGDNIIVTPHTQIGAIYTIIPNDLNRIDIDVTKSGYTCIGLLSLQDNHGSYTQFRGWYVENNKVIVHVLSGETYSDYIILASLLYKKN